MNETSDSKPPISIELGAKASIELKAEIPKQSMGRLIDALTDAIRPFTEGRGLKADLIRLQREEVALRIAQLAEKQAAIEGAKLHPVSPKFLVPFLEKASLEDQDTPLHKRWAALLISASKSYHARQLTFTDILSRLSSEELLLLEDVCFHDRMFFKPIHHHTLLEMNNGSVREQMHLLKSESNKDEEIALKAFQFRDCAHVMLGKLMYVLISTKSGSAKYHWFEWEQKRPSLELLQREGLVKIENLGTVGYFNLTELGVDFVRDCTLTVDINNAEAALIKDVVGTGTVKSFSADRGYGFITPDSGGGDIFVDISAAERAALFTLYTGQRLGFEATVLEGHEQPSAINIWPIDKKVSTLNLKSPPTGRVGK